MEKLILIITLVFITTSSYAIDLDKKQQAEYEMVKRVLSEQYQARQKELSRVREELRDTQSKENYKIPYNCKYRNK